MVKTGDQFQKNTAYEHPEKKALYHLKPRL